MGAKLIEELYQNKQKLYLYANSIINGISDCALLMDDHLNIIQANKYCLNFLGLEEYEIVGKHINDIMWDKNVDLSMKNLIHNCWLIAKEWQSHAP